MATFLVIYALLLVLIVLYVVVNVYHLVRFRLDVPGDKSPIAMAVYLLFVVGILIASIMMATLAYRI